MHRFAFGRTWRFVASAALGVGWNVIVVVLMGGRPREALAPAWLVAGVVTGLAAGAFTIRSRERTGGRETLGGVLATYYLGMAVDWLAFAVTARILMCVRYGGWTDFDLRDHLMLIVTFAAYGTPWLLALGPLTWLSRRAIWALHVRSLARGAG